MENRAKRQNTSTIAINQWVVWGWRPLCLARGSGSDGDVTTDVVEVGRVVRAARDFVQIEPQGPTTRLSLSRGKVERLEHEATRYKTSASGDSAERERPSTRVCDVEVGSVR